LAKTITRVYLLAKELGVASKAILTKCDAEGMELKGGHMTPLTAGQAATIREWFSEGKHATAVETSGPVDLDKVRVHKKKTAEAVSETVEPVVEEQQVDEVGEPVTEEIAQPETEVVAETEAQAPADSEIAAEEPQTETAPAAAVVETPVEPAKPVVEAPVYPTPVMHVPPKPKDVKPAGPMHTPKPAKLSGPTVIRVESVEPDALRPPRKGGKPVREKPKAPAGESLNVGKTVTVSSPSPASASPAKGKKR